MCRVGLANGVPFVAFLVGAATVDVATAETPWYLVALWVGAGITGGVFATTGVICLVSIALKHLKAIRIRNDWRCTYWTKEQQLKVTVWFDDQLHSSRYNADCVAQVGQQVVHLNDDVELGGSYFGRRGIVSGHSGPVMAEFLKREVALEPPESATVRVTIQPRDPWGAASQETKAITIQLVTH